MMIVLLRLMLILLFLLMQLQLLQLLMLLMKLNFSQNFDTELSHGTRTCIKRKKIDYGKKNYFRAQKCI